MGRPKQPTKSN